MLTAQQYMDISLEMLTAASDVQDTDPVLATVLMARAQTYAQAATGQAVMELASRFAAMETSIVERVTQADPAPQEKLRIGDSRRAAADRAYSQAAGAWDDMTGRSDAFTAAIRADERKTVLMQLETFRAAMPVRERYLKQSDLVVFAQRFGVELPHSPHAVLRDRTDPGPGPQPQQTPPPLPRSTEPVGVVQDAESVDESTWVGEGPGSGITTVIRHTELSDTPFPGFMAGDPDPEFDEHGARLRDSHRFGVTPPPNFGRAG